MSQQEQDPINEYEEVKSQNRRRLIGGGALALVAGATRHRKKTRR